MGELRRRYDHPVTAQLKPIVALLCDDVRYEIADAISIMGLNTTTLQITKFPHRKRLVFVLILAIEVEGTVEVTTTVRWRGDERWSAKHEIAVGGLDTAAHLPLDGPMAVLDQPGTLELLVDIEGAPQFVQRWVVEPAEGEITAHVLEVQIDPPSAARPKARASAKRLSPPRSPKTKAKRT